MKQNKQEIWKDIIGYEGYYEASNLGRIRSLDRWVIFKNCKKCFYKGRFFEGSDVNGYKKVCLSRDGISETFFIHQLIAMTFLNHTPDGSTLVVDHIDGDRSNDNVDNLRVVTHRDNSTTCYRANEDSFSSDFVGVSYSKTNKKFRADIQLNSKQIFLGYFENEEDAAKAYQKALSKINNNTFYPEDYKPKWTSNFKGVYFDKVNQKWVANPYINGKRIYLGIHTTEDEAHQAILEFEAIQPILI